MNKKCSICNEEKPLTEYSKNKSCNDGLDYRCKNCYSAYYSKYRKKNLLKVKVKDKKYHQSDSYKNSTAHKEWLESNPDKKKSYWNKYTTNKRNQKHPNHNKYIEAELREMAVRLTKCLGIQYEMDHVWPLSKGGLHHHENLQVITSSLNQQKHNSLCFFHPTVKNFTDLPKWIQKEMVMSNGKKYYDEIKLAIEQKPVGKV